MASDPMCKVIEGEHPQMPRKDVLPDGKEMGRNTVTSQDSGYKGYQREGTFSGAGEEKSRDKQTY